MEDDENYLQISPQEAASIDINKVAYYTLVDGTIILIKKKGENKGIQKGGEKIVNQYPQSYGEEKRAPIKFQNISQKNNILQPGENYRFYISKEGKNIIQPQQKQIQHLYKDYLNYNPKLINTQNRKNPIMNPLNIRNLFLSGPLLMKQEGPMRKRQLYKIVHLIPARKNNISQKTFINQNTNSRFKYQKYNMQQKMDINKRAMPQYNQQQFQNVNQLEYQAYQGGEISDVMIDNKQNFEYYTYGIGNVNEVKCTCPKGN